ncbi:MAG: putative lipid II flippase FtsW [Xanthomonadales bacterium]|nr:putative lipid II flippase FtsW [Xanthomonadales bacterium]MCC6561173.1 putative lipid II flippase FtsW [Xanthomonadales bacterium]
MRFLTTPLQALRRDEIPGCYDRGLFAAAVALALFGVVMVASSSVAIGESEGGSAYHYLSKHLAYLAMGCVLGAGFALTPLALIERHARLFLLLSLALLLAVFLPGFGVRVNGAKRWLRFGLANFQAVEAVKLFVIIWLASYLVRFRGEVQHAFRGTFKPLVIAAVIVLLLLQQPDFGSASLLLAIVLGMIWLGGARARDLFGLAASATPVMAWAALSESYRVKRLTSFLDPWKDPFNDGFQLTQALIAIGRGEWFGVGLGGSIQKLFYLPEAHTDFILAVIAEELGLLGVCLVIGMFAFLCGRLFLLGRRAEERGLGFAAYVAYGIAIWLSVQATVSIGVNLGLLPTKGLTLPLISSGGSSLLMTCAAIGVALRISYELTRHEAVSAVTPAAGGRDDD